MRELLGDDDEDNDIPLNVVAKRQQGTTGQREDKGNQGQTP